MKKRLALLLLVLAVLAGGFWGYRKYQDTYITIGGVRYDRDVAELDLSGTAPEFDRIALLRHLKALDMRNTGLTEDGYAYLSRELPDCAIRWSVPFGGGTADSGSTDLQVTALTEGDLHMLSYFPELTKVDAMACGDYGMIARLISRYPHLEVAYQVELEGEVFLPAVEELQLEGTDLTQLDENLQYLPLVKAVTLSKPVQDGEGLNRLLTHYPDVRFRWTVEAFGKTVPCDITELDLSGIPMTDTREVEAAAACLPDLEKVLMCDCGISNEEMEALNQRWENVLFVWTVDIGPYITLRTDVDNFMPVGQFGASVTTEDCENLRYCTEIRCLDLGHQPVYACDFVAYMPHMKYLILADTGVSDISPLANLKELVFLEIFISPITDMSPLLGCTALEDLNICYTYGDPEVLGQMTWLKRLWWDQSDDRGLTAAQQQRLVEMLPDTEVEFNCHSSTGGTWRFGQRYYEMRDMLGRDYMQG